MPLTKEQTDKIFGMLQSTWDHIAGDTIAMCREQGTKVTLAICVEMVCDADRYVRHSPDPETLAIFQALDWKGMQRMGRAALKDYYQE